MNRVWGYVVLLRGRFDAMTPLAQGKALFHAGIDVMILLLLATAIYVGLTQLPATFFFWVPLLAALSWWRLKQARDRWSL